MKIRFSGVTLFVSVVIASACLKAQTLNVQVTAPAAGTHFAECSDIFLSADASVEGGEIKSVTFYRNGLLLYPDSKAPFEFNWKNVPPGYYSITAVLKDKTTLSDTSAAVPVIVGDIVSGDVLANGKFNCRSWPWVLNADANYGAKASFEIEPDAWIADSAAAAVMVENGGVNDWDVQLQQPFPVDSGHTYTVYFTAMCTETKDINFAIQQNVSPWTPYYLGYATVGELGQFGPYEFICTLTDHNAWIRFNIGNSGQSSLMFWLDEVRVIDASVSGVEGRRSASSLMPGSLSVGSYPNPFNSRTFIRYDLPAGADVSLDLFNMKGQAVRTLVSEKQGSGIQQASWDGLDSNGSPAPSGVYIYNLRARTAQEMQTVSGKLILLE